MKIIRAPDKNWCRRIGQVAFNLVDYEAAFSTIIDWIRLGRHDYVTLVNPHSVLLCNRDPQMRQALQQAGMVLPDGVGIILAARLLGYPHHGRVTGPNFMLNVCNWGRSVGYSHFFYGGGPGIADQLAERLCRLFPGLRVAGTFCPPFRDLTEAQQQSNAAMINAAQPDILWVGLGAPKQEKWMLQNTGQINAPVMIGVGAAFDFHSGNARWAPSLVRQLGLEWAFRLAHEPRRLWRRNLDSLSFLFGVLKQAAQQTGRRLITNTQRRKRNAPAG